MGNRLSIALPPFRTPLPVVGKSIKNMPFADGS